MYSLVSPSKMGVQIENILVCLLLKADHFVTIKGWNWIEKTSHSQADKLVCFEASFQIYMYVVSHWVARGWNIKESLHSTRSDDFTYPPIDEGRDTSWLSSTLSVVILLSLPILCGRVFSRFVERWRSLNEIQPSTSSGSSVILFLHASKYINCFRLPIS